MKELAKHLAEEKELLARSETKAAAVLLDIASPLSCMALQEGER